MSLFADPSFRRIWFAGLASGVVRWLEVLAFGAFAYATTESAFIVVILTMLRQLPMALLGVFVGALADRLDGRRVQIAGYLIMLTQTVVLGSLAVSGRLEVWHLAIAAFLSGSFWTGDNPVRRTMLGEAAGSGRLGIAMSIDASTNNFTRMLGPALGGGLLALIGIKGAFLLSGSFYLLGLAAMLRLSWHRPVTVLGGPGLLASMRGGLGLLRGDRRLQGVLAITAIYNIFGWPAASLIPVIGRDDLGLGLALVGLMQSVEGAGAFLCGIVAGVMVKERHYMRLYLGGAICFQLAMIAFALTPIPLPAYLAWLVAGLGSAAVGAMQPTLVLIYAPSEARGRMMGLLSVSQGTGLLGFLLLSPLPALIGAAPAVLAIGLLGLAGIAASCIWWRELR